MFKFFKSKVNEKKESIDSPNLSDIYTIENFLSFQLDYTEKFIETFSTDISKNVKVQIEFFLLSYFLIDLYLSENTYSEIIRRGLFDKTDAILLRYANQDNLSLSIINLKELFDIRRYNYGHILSANGGNINKKLFSMVKQYLKQNFLYILNNDTFLINHSQSDLNIILHPEIANKSETPESNRIDIRLNMIDIHFNNYKNLYIKGRDSINDFLSSISSLSGYEKFSKLKDICQIFTPMEILKCYPECKVYGGNILTQIDFMHSPGQFSPMKMNYIYVREKKDIKIVSVAEIFKNMDSRTFYSYISCNAEKDSLIEFFYMQLLFNKYQNFTSWTQFRYLIESKEDIEDCKKYIVNHSFSDSKILSSNLPVFDFKNGTLYVTAFFCDELVSKKLLTLEIKSNSYMKVIKEIPANEELNILF